MFRAQGAVPPLLNATAVALAALVLALVPAVAGAEDLTAPFKETTNPTTFGQAPVFVPHTDPQLVVFGADRRQGQKNQVYLERFDGRPWHGISGPICLTCVDVPDPGAGNDAGSDPNNVNGVPAVSPDGRWLIFHSWRGHYLTIGSPGYGGIGSALWALDLSAFLAHPAVSAPQYRLTQTAQSNFSGEGYDDYHAYFSPDGSRIEYAHLNWNFATGGGSGKWDVRVARFTVANGIPSLTDTHVVRPANGHWYETQWWNPNPATPGFLYTETYPAGSGTGQASVPQLFLCRLVEDYSRCQVTRLTDDAAWDEQALFTPDGRDVVFMSSRDHPGLFNSWASTARTLGLPNDADNLLILPLFEAGFLQPAGQEATDLYITSLADPDRVRRLTSDGDHGWITPEFTWDPTNRFLMWTENRYPDGYRYGFPPSPAWAAQLQALLSTPPDPASIVNVNANGVGVAPLPFEQRTLIARFGPTDALRSRRRFSSRRAPNLPGTPRPARGRRTSGTGAARSPLPGGRAAAARGRRP